MSDVAISVVVLVKDHEQHIRPCLDTLHWADEVVLVNDNSLDQTLAIARTYPNVRIVDRALNGDWSAQMNFGIEQAKGDWILQMDVDERVPDDLASELQLLSQNAEIAAVEMLILGTFLGKLRGGSPTDATVVRMVRKNCGLFDARRVHARIQVKGKVVRAKYLLVHLGPFPDAHGYWVKNAFYAEVEAEHHARIGRHMPDTLAAGWITYVFKPCGIFLQKYFLQGGWREGLYGLHYAMARAIGYYMVYLASWERQRGAVDEIEAYCKLHGIPHLDKNPSDTLDS